MTNNKRLAATLVLLASASAALAQNSPASQPLPGLDTFSIPSTRPTPQRVPDPEPTIRPGAGATPRPVAPAVTVPPATVPTLRVPPARVIMPTAPRPMPAPPRTAAPRAVASPPVASPAPSAAPLAPPTPLASALPPGEAPLPAAPAQPQPLPPSDRAVPPWTWLIAGGVLLAIVVGGVGWWRLRPVARRADRRIVDEDRDIFVPTAAAAEPSAPAPPVVPPPAPVARPMPPAPALADARAVLELELIPDRAGTDPAGLAVHYLIVVRNTGKVAASAVRLDVRLLGAGPGQDSMIAAMFARPIDAPVMPPFALPAGAAAEFAGSAAHPRATLDVVTIGGQRAVVPVLAVNLRYEWRDDLRGDRQGHHGQTAQSYVIGIARGAEAKLRPFPLDGSDRMHASVSALDYPVRAVS